MSTIAATLDLLVRTHRAARDYRLVSTRVKSAPAITELCADAERELPKLSAVERKKLRDAVEVAREELRGSVLETEKEMS